MWDYAALTQSAAAYGGPDAFVRACVLAICVPHCEQCFSAG